MAEGTQRIARLTPLADVLARIDALVTPVAPRRVETRAALGRVLAEDVVAAAASAGGRAGLARRLRGRRPISLLGRELLRAGAACARRSVSMPGRRCRRTPTRSRRSMPWRSVMVEVAAIAPVAPGDGVLVAGADIAAGTVLRRAGRDRCAPPISRCSRPPGSARSRSARRASGWSCRRVSGDAVHRCRGSRPRSPPSLPPARSLATAAGDLTAALGDTNADAIIVVGGTGAGRNDASVRALAAAGRVEVHGVALPPGETAAFGIVGQRPVLLVPGRLDAALAVWLTLGRHLLARLSGAIEERVRELGRAHAQACVAAWA